VTTRERTRLHFWHERCFSIAQERTVTMLYWAAVFFIIALVAGGLGFFGIAAGAASIAKILFIVFLVLAIVSLVVGRRGPAL
jgi:uncharacterized membrane protein YtjA (UPF0391 family)